MKADKELLSTIADILTFFGTRISLFILFVTYITWNLPPNFILRILTLSIVSAVIGLIISKRLKHD